MHYRVHSRQMLCIGGSQIPFGWSFLSIAKVPMTWSEGDIWTAEVRRLLSAARLPTVQPAACDTASKDAVGAVHGGSGTSCLRTGGAACEYEGRV